MAADSQIKIDSIISGQALVIRGDYELLHFIPLQ